MIYVPEKFQCRHPFKYPGDNHSCFEEWYFDNHDFQEGERHYLPIFWTGYYVRANFGQNKKLMDELQRFLNTLDGSLKYYTIIQYDNGILHNLSNLDIKIFSMSGGRTDYPLPLISQGHSFIHPNLEPHRFFANFIGNLTHDLRAIVVHYAASTDNYYTATHKHDLSSYCDILNRSTFTLCPRGFGPTSFRIQEALQYGSIPVYISDEFVIPHNVPFDQYGVLIEAKDAHRVHEILSAIPPEEIKSKQGAIPEIYKKYFTYEGNKDLIKKAVSHEKVCH